MTLEKIREIIETALKNLYLNQPNIFSFSAQTGQTEWNLAHHLANELHALLPEFDCDLDVTKHEYGNLRPDIIFHTRGTNKDNLLVIETKFRRDNQAVERDVEKITREWFMGNLNYQYGASINIVDAKMNKVHLLDNRNKSRLFFTC